MKITLELGLSLHSFQKWIRNNHSNLTKLETIAAIVKHTGVKEENVFKSAAA